MNNRTKNALYSLFLILAVALVYWWRGDAKPRETYLQGQTMGTIAYHIRYIATTDLFLKPEIDSLLRTFNGTLSTYISDSDLSRFNDSEGGISLSSPFFYPLLQETQQIYKLSAGAFDPTVMPLVNYWGFGPQKQEPLKDSLPHDLLDYVGWEYIEYNRDSLFKKHPKVELDFSGIAKGYAVDLVADLLEHSKIEHYLIEIGGEVRCKGRNLRNEIWRIGIEQPNENNSERAVAQRVELNNRALATSGSYRNFYVLEGKKYAHTINPKTGYPVQHNLLSVSVFAPTCRRADALATAIMVLGVEKGQKIIEAYPAWDAIFITADSGKLETRFSSGIKPLQ